MKKKNLILYLTLLLALLVLFTSCGSDDKPVKEDVKEDVAEEVVEEEEEAEEVDDAPETVYVDEKVLLDEDDILVKIVELLGDPVSGPFFNFYIENNSDKDIKVGAEDLSLNDIMSFPFFNVALEAGESTTAKMEFYMEELEQARIDLITNMELRIHIAEDGEWEPFILTDPIEIEVHNTGDYEQSYDFDGQEVLDGDYRALIGELFEDDFGDPAIRVFLENNTDEFISIQTWEVYVNGTKVRPHLYAEISPGKKYVGHIMFNSDELEEADIENIEEFEAVLLVFDPETRDELFESEPFTIDF